MSKWLFHSGQRSYSSLMIVVAAGGGIPVTLVIILIICIACLRWRKRRRLEHFPLHDK